MKINRIIALTSTVLLAVGALTACAGTEPADPKPTATRTASVSPRPVSTPPVPTPSSTPETDTPDAAQVPDVVGMNHADAMATLHEAGFMVNEEDASPEGRWIIDNSNWQVCRQDPAPGTTGVLRVAIYSVKLDESC